jgi:gliding motility-associated-like protein
MRFTFAFALLLLIAPFVANTQTVEILNEDFEGPTNVWSTTGNSGSNQWVINTCAGNGPSVAGSNSVYISKGGPDSGCGTTGDIQYRYDDAVSGSEFTIVFTTVDAACLENLQFTVDYKLIGEGYNGTSGPFHDFGQIVYSLDGGTTWTNATNEFYNVPPWSTVTLPLPAVLNGQSFEFGIMWTFDNSLINDPPLAMDNISITGEDNTPPSVTCQGDINVPANNLCQISLADYTNTVTVNDACTPTPNLTITQSPAIGSLLDQSTGPHNISFLVEDENGNSNTCSFNITIIDTTSPAISCPGNQTVYVDNSCDYNMVDLSGLTTITDNCSTLGNMTIAQNPIVGTILSNHGTTQTVDIVVTDEGGNSNQCSFDIILSDTISPVLNCPNDTNIYADASCEATVPDYTGVVVATDNCTNPGSIVISQNPVAGGTLSGLGANQLITIQAVDLVGNSSTCQFTVNLLDTISPAVTCPPTQTLNGNASCMASVPDFSALITNSDNCSNTINLTYTQSPTIGSMVTGPVTIGTITIEDESGNTNSCDFDIEVIDIFPPNITCPPNQDLYLNGNCETTVPDFSGSTVVTDNCLTPGQLAITQNPIAGTVLPGAPSSAIITMFVADTSGNNNQCQFTVNLIDTIAPTISCPSDSTVYVDAACAYAVADYSSGATVLDNCSISGNITVTQDITVGTIYTAGVHPIVLTATDENGNGNSCTFNLNILDTISPNFTLCPGNLDAYVNSSCQAVLTDITSQTTAIDNCGGTISYSQSPVAGTVISSNTDVSITATDDSGNSTVCIIRVNLMDSLPPNITVCPPDQIVTVSPACTYTLADYTGLTAAVDNCTPIGGLIVSQSPSPGTLMTGNTIVTISVKDQNANASECTINIIVNDNTPPSITTCVTDQTEYVDTNCAHILIDYTPAIVATDACGSVTIAQSPTPGTVMTPGITTVYFIATDSAGNVDSCQFDLTVLDTISPTIICPMDIQSCDTVVTFANPITNDNCDVPLVTRTDASGLNSGDVFPIGITTISYEVMDNSTNSATCSFDIEVIALPDNAAGGLDIDLCEVDTSLLAGNTATVGIGTWTIVSGTASLDNSNDPNTTIRNLEYGETILTWQINNQICSSNIDTLRINRYQNPSIALVSDTIQTCGDTSTLIGNLPTIGLGTWTNTFGAGTIALPNSNISAVTDLFAGENIFVWTISNGICIPTTDTLRIISNEAPSIVDGGGHQDLCDTTDQINLIALQPDFGTGIWSVYEGNGVIDHDTALSVIVSGIDGNPNTLLWTVSKQYCPDLIDTITVNYYACIPFNPEIPTAFTPDGDGINDTWIIPDLNKFYPDCKVLIVNRWGNKVFESEGYVEPWDGRYKGNILPFGSYFYVIDFNNGSDNPLSGSITIIK